MPLTLAHGKPETSTELSMRLQASAGCEDHWSARHARDPAREAPEAPKSAVCQTDHGKRPSKWIVAYEGTSVRFRVSLKERKVELEAVWTVLGLVVVAHVCFFFGVCPDRSDLSKFATLQLASPLWRYAQVNELIHFKITAIPSAIALQWPPSSCRSREFAGDARTWMQVSQLACCSGTWFTLPHYGYIVSNMFSEFWYLT